MRRLVAYGVTREELDREITENRASLVAALAGAATRPTPSLASTLVETVDSNQVFTSPAQDLATFESAVKGLSRGHRRCGPEGDLRRRRAAGGAGHPRSGGGRRGGGWPPSSPRPGPSR